MSIFNSIPSYRPPRSKQIQKSTRAQDMELGIVYPVYFKEVVPGDNLHMNMSDVIRSLPMVKPTLGNLDICVDAFYCDYRQLDPNFEDNLSGGESGTVDFTKVIDEAFTESNATDSRLNGNKMAMHAEKYSLNDYCGFPMLEDDDDGAFIGDGMVLTPYRALCYNRAWNYYYRDENVCVDTDGTPLLEHDKIGDGRTCFGAFGNTEGNKYVLKPGSGLKHCYLEKDYLGAVLPKRMKGGPFAFPVSGSATVLAGYNGNVSAGVTANMPLLASTGDGFSAGDREGFKFYRALFDKDGKAVSIPSKGYNSSVNLYDEKGTLVCEAGKALSNDWYSASNPLGNVYADLGSSITFTYDEFREIRALQLYAERLNLCGSRYEEFLMSMFSVAPHSDTLREPMWLGGFSQPLVVGEVMQNSDSASSPLGNYAGKGSSSTSGHFFDFFCKDFGVVMICCHIRPKVLYTQGIDRQLIKRNRFDWFNPLFAGLSEQEVLKCEAHTAPVTTFTGQSHASDILGFNPRYSELYFDKNTVCGDLRDEQPYWVWSRKFGSNAVLNGETMLCKHSEYSDRWAVTDLPPFIAEFNFNLDITRPCSAYPTPSR